MIDSSSRISTENICTATCQLALLLALYKAVREECYKGHIVVRFNERVLNQNMTVRNTFYFP